MDLVRKALYELVVLLELTRLGPYLMEKCGKCVPFDFAPAA